VIVTGAAGFIGSHLCRALLGRGVDVIGIDNFDAFYSRAMKENNLASINLAVASDKTFTFIEADIRDAARMLEVFSDARPHCVFHLAALAGVRPSIADPARYVSVNIDGLTSVLEAARAANCRNMVFASSSSVYGNNAKTPFAETDPVDEPISPYAATKRAGELICHTYAHVFNMRIAALRFFTVYGARQRPDLAISKFMRLIAAGEEVPMFGDGSTSRDYTYINDIIEGVLAAYHIITAARSFAQSPKESSSSADTSFFRIYNLGSDHPITLAEMIDAIAKVVGKPARIKRMPMQPGDVERTWADLVRSREELKYAPSTSFQDGLATQFDSLTSPASVD
jgi:UDP-glucuronate 4-epimerase